MWKYFIHTIAIMGTLVSVLIIFWAFLGLRYVIVKMFENVIIFDKRNTLYIFVFV